MANPRKKRTYQTRLVKDNYSYTSDQISDLFKINIETVRRWVKEEGLEGIPKTRPLLIHSTALKAFLKKKKSDRKKACLPHEVFCCKCKEPHAPEIGSGSIQIQPNNCVRFQGICPDHGIKIHKTIKAEEWTETHPLRAFLHDATKEHNGAQFYHRECQFEKGEQICLDLTP